MIMKNKTFVESSDADNVDTLTFSSDILNCSGEQVALSLKSTMIRGGYFRIDKKLARQIGNYLLNYAKGGKHAKRNIQTSIIKRRNKKKDK